MIHNIITDTDPYLLHFCSGIKRYNGVLRYIREEWYKNNHFNNKINAFDIVSVMSSNIKESPILHQMGDDVIILGGHLSKRDYRKEGNITKLLLYVDYLKNNANKHTLFVDSTDVIFVRHPHDLFRQYIGSGSKIIIGAEKRFSYFWKRENSDNFDSKDKTVKMILDSMNINKTAWKSLNSGCIIGNNNLLLKFFRDVLDCYDENVRGKINKKSDQSAIMYYLTKGCDLVSVDFDCVYFQSMHRLNVGEYEMLLK